jgi:chromosome segregation ATPase
MASLRDQLEREREEYRRLRRLERQWAYQPAANRTQERAIRHRLTALRADMARCRQRGEALLRAIEEDRWTS